jgi:uncharacterized membrane protein YbhN (UPF0104 family)
MGAFDATLVGLLPHAPQAELFAALIVYRALLELVPLLTAATVFALYELWWRLPAQRSRVADLRATREREED